MESPAQERSSLPELLRLDNQLCFSIYAASRAITRAYRPILDRYNLTYPQYLVLLTLWEKDSLVVSDIGKRLYLDSGTLTPLLKRMEQTGYIFRHRDSQDERKVEIRLTDKALELKKEALAIPNELIRDTKLGELETGHIKSMVDVLLSKLMQCAPNSDKPFSDPNLD